MTLFGSLKVSTTGLKAQGTKMGAISDNIANVNTVGYKRTDVQFSTLVTERMSATKFNPGGVTARPRQTNDQAGQISGTSVTTDFAVSGRGWFVVTEKATFNPSESSDGLAYTRAGSFRPDEDGYLKNTAGYYLQGWTVNKNGDVTKDGTDADFIIDNPNETNLEPVNINRITNIAEQTENVRIRANVPSEFEPSSGLYLGAAALAADAALGAGVSTIGLAASNAVTGAGGTAAQAAAAQTEAITQARAGNLPSIIGAAVSSAVTTAGGTAAQAAAASAAVITQAEALTAASNTKAGFDTEINAGVTTASVPNGHFNNSFTVYDAQGMAHSVRLDWYRVTQGGANAETNTWAVRLAYDKNSGANAGDEAGVDNSVTDVMTDLVETSDRDANGDGIVDGQEDGLGALYEAEIESDNANATVNTVTTAAFAALPAALRATAPLNSVANMDAAIAAEYGANATPDDAVAWLEENIPSVEEPRFVVWDGNSSTNGSSVLQTDTLFFKFNGDGSLEGTYTDPSFAASSRTVARNGEPADPFKMLSIAVGSVKMDTTSGAVGSSTASSNLVSARSKGSPFDVQGAQSLVFDWDVGTPTAATTSANGVVNANYAGTGLDGITNFDSGEKTPTLEEYFVSQDGLRAGTLSGVILDDEGMLTAIYDNGAQRSIYKIPLAAFTNDNGLINETGNVYLESKESGDMQINAAKQGVNGSTVGSALESSNVDLGDEFTDMIVTQQGFTANTRAITTTDEMLTDINNMVR